MVSPIHVVGIGLNGRSGLPPATEALINQATLLVGSDRHLSYFPHHPAQRITIGSLQTAIASIQDYLQSARTLPTIENAPHLAIVILVSGDPLFFGLGRLLLQSFSPNDLIFYPHLSSVQLAFNRIKIPWQDATILSLHGRPPDDLLPALRKGNDKIAILTDGINTPEAIARLVQSLSLPIDYHLWVCENLGDDQEKIQHFRLDELVHPNDRPAFAPLNIVILVRTYETKALVDDRLPILGIADQDFASFSDRPGLMTKREIRTLILGELQLQPHQTIWDIGAGTGSVSIEMARLNPTASLYAIEKTAMGISLIQENVQRFKLSNIFPIQGTAPESTQKLPPPDRIFLGGSGGQMKPILDHCGSVLRRGGCIVIAVATVEHQSTVMEWIANQQSHPSSNRWTHHLLSIALSRSIPVGSLTRLNPLNPVTIITLRKKVD